MKFRLQLVVVNDSGYEQMQEMARLERAGVEMETLGLTLAESKLVLKRIQEVMVEEQVNDHVAQRRSCPACCQFQRYLRIRADRAEINANVAMLFANGVCERDLPRDSSMPSDLVMICQWASLFTQSMDSRMTICSGGSNGSAALATIRAFPASPKSMSA